MTDNTSHKVWFGGDTGYGEVFREIGQRAGPFDLALVGIGAYEPRIIMQASHATPEEGAKSVHSEPQADFTASPHSIQPAQRGVLGA